MEDSLLEGEKKGFYAIFDFLYFKYIDSHWIEVFNVASSSLSPFKNKLSIKVYCDFLNLEVQC